MLHLGTYSDILGVVDYSSITLRESWCVNSKQLNDVDVGGCQARDRVLVGSFVGLHEMLEDWTNMGYQVHVQPRAEGAGESFVDDVLVDQVQRALQRSEGHHNSNKTLVLLSGDDNDDKGRASFDKVVREAVSDWEVEGGSLVWERLVRAGVS